MATAKKEAAPKTPVTLTTGEVVEFGAKERMKKSDVLADGHATVRFAFRNGEVREFSFGKHHDLLMRLAIHGARQKIGDETAGVDDIDDAVTAVDSVIARLEKGDWGTERVAGNSFAGASIVLKAIAEAKGCDVNAAKEFVERTLAKYEAAGKPVTRQALYAQFRVPGTKTAPIIARLEAEKAASQAAKNGAPTADDMLADDFEVTNEGGDAAVG